MFDHKRFRGVDACPDPILSRGGSQVALLRFQPHARGRAMPGGIRNFAAARAASFMSLRAI